MRELVDELLNGPRPSAEDAFLRVVEMDEEEAMALFETLGTETTFLMYRELQEEPKIPRELADILDTSIQNVHYHLEKLERSNLVEPVETWRSEKGVEMNVYAPIHDPLVIHFGSESNRERLRTLLCRAFGAVGGIVLASVLVELAARRWLAPTSEDPETGDGPYMIGSEGSADPGLLESILLTPGLLTIALTAAALVTYLAYRHLNR